MLVAGSWLVAPRAGAGLAGGVIDMASSTRPAERNCNAFSLTGRWPLAPAGGVFCQLCPLGPAAPTSPPTSPQSTSTSATNVGLAVANTLHVASQG
jgi:hypothetical protein